MDANKEKKLGYEYEEGARYVAYVSSYTKSREHKYGIRIYDVDMENGYLKEKKQVEITNSSYVSISHNRKYLYSITDEGVESYKCSCGYVSQTRPVAKKAHNGVWATTVQPSCAGRFHRGTQLPPACPVRQDDQGQQVSLRR